MKIIKSIMFYLLICVSVINANNCKNFLTMEGDGQQMSIMLCMNTNFPQSSVISKTNLSNSVIYNYLLYFVNYLHLLNLLKYRE